MSQFERCVKIALVILDSPQFHMGFFDMKPCDLRDACESAIADITCFENYSEHIDSDNVMNEVAKRLGPP